MKGLGDVQYALLSGDYMGLALGELEAILEAESGYYERILALDGLALYRASPGSARLVAGRSGLIKESGWVLGLGGADKWREVVEGGGQVLRELGEPVRVELRAFKGYCREMGIDSRKIAGVLGDLGVELDPREGRAVRVFLSDGVIMVGLPGSRRPDKELYNRMPGKRPFYKPGPLLPYIARAMVNLSRVRRGRGAFLDPFCGTGGFILESCLLGVPKNYCIELDPETSRGSLANIEWMGCSGSSLNVVGDAASLPLGEDSIDYISTDPPYGRATSPRGRIYRRLISLFLEDAARVLKRGGYVVYAGPHSERPWELAGDAGLKVVGRYHMFVHASLVREVVVAKKV